MRASLRLPAVALVALGIVLPTARGYIIIDSFSSAKNDRFANNASFVATGFDLSGIALDNAGHWLAMISPNVYLSANHYHSAAGTSVTFYESNDPNGAKTTRQLSNPALQIGTSDLWIGTINQPLTSDYTYYDFATEDITSEAGFYGSTYYLEEAFMFGRSKTTSWPTSQDMAVGKNKLDLWWEPPIEGSDPDHPFDPDDPAIGAFRDPPPPPDTGNFVDSEACVQPGDSGGGMFVANGSKLTLVGLNWFVGNDELGNPVASGFSYVGNYDAEIQAFLDLHSVPEPARLAVVSALLALGFAAWHRNLRH